MRGYPFTLRGTWGSLKTWQSWGSGSWDVGSCQEAAFSWYESVPECKEIRGFTVQKRANGQNHHKNIFLMKAKDSPEPVVDEEDKSQAVDIQRQDDRGIDWKNG
ncbi:hypothetical protein OIU77_001108 [Salix suchowensis]|uniref:Uncharacterized protein n=1 Tax=Salix suchowensis TaxID=1278906 RepID=A0ABQ8ZGD6_9ROSI|nr:hypothetical protein OIU77_001108 [Salix suchowensis]